jgi:hypothetical protein
MQLIGAGARDRSDLVDVASGGSDYHKTRHCPTARRRQKGGSDVSLSDYWERRMSEDPRMSEKERKGGG